MRSLLLPLTLILASCAGSEGGTRKTRSGKPPSRRVLDRSVDARDAGDRGRELQKLLSGRTKDASTEQRLFYADIYEALGNLPAASRELDIVWAKNPRMDLLIRRVMLRAIRVRPLSPILVRLLKRDLPYPPFFSPLSEYDISSEEQKRVIEDFREAYKLLSQTRELKAIAIVDLSKELVTGKYGMVLRETEPLLEHPTFGPFAARLRSRAALAVGETEVALSAAALLRKRYPVLLETFLLTGLAQLQAGKTKEAHQELTIAALLSPGNLEASVAVMYTTWKQEGTKGASGIAAPTREAQFLLALMLARDGKNKKAVEMAMEFAKRHPDPVIGRLGLAWVKHICRDSEAALAVLSEYARGDNLRSEVMATRGLILFSLGKYVDAARSLRVADDLLPGDPQVRFSLASALLRSGQLEEAENILTRALRTVPTSVPHLLERARVRMQRVRLEEASRDLARARLLDSTHPELDLLDGNVYLLSGQFKKAEASLERYLRANPEHANARMLRAISRVDQKLFKKAEEDLNYLLRKGREIPRVLEYRAICRSGRGNLDGAIEDLGRAIRIAPESPRLYRLRGKLLKRAGEKEAALNDLVRAIQLRPEWKADLEGLVEELRKSLDD